MSNNHQLSCVEIYNLIDDLHTIILSSGRSFCNDNIGSMLSYLTCAVYRNEKIELNESDVFFRMLTELFHKNHSVWMFIDLEKTVYCVMCNSNVSVHDARFASPLSGWLCKEGCNAR